MERQDKHIGKAIEDEGAEVEGHAVKVWNATGEGSATEDGAAGVGDAEDGEPEVEGHLFGMAGAPASERGGHPGVRGSLPGGRRSD